ncbi:MAG TPA: arginine--tRNA ligase [Candidatus Paceibacterota bacterium]|nr:arginine--tRNA ligase [Candidatus Paceibacterota bacterium]
MIRSSIEEAIKSALREIGASEANFVVERPGSFDHGDYASNAALAAAKALKKSPREVAEDLKKILESQNISGIEKIDIAGAGFINYFVSPDAIRKEVSAAAQDDSFGKNRLYAGKKIMVEYTDPNPFKEFHIGHLMSNAIGEAVARALEYSGAEVKRGNYQGDVGPHVAKAVWGKMQKPDFSWGEAYVYGSEQYEANKEEIDAINKKIYEKSDEKINSLYAQGREESLKRFEEIYKALGTTFDFYFFESESGPKGLVAVQARKDIFEESDGAVVYRGEKDGLHTRVFVTKLGLPTYEAKDLGLAEMKKEIWEFDISITITANEQAEYFKVILSALFKIHPEWRGQFKHVSHGMMRFAQGKMSSRKGNIITGESLLEDLREGAREKMKDRQIVDPETIAQNVSVGAIKYAVLKQGSGKDIIFDPEKSLSLEGDSGPYLQYAHTRALSLLREAKKAGIEGSMQAAPAQPHTLERLLLHFPNVVERAAQELEPHYITTYLTELAGAFNSWYAQERVIGGKNEKYGVLLVQAIEKTLAKGLHVLGIPAPEEM